MGGAPGCRPKVPGYPVQPARPQSGFSGREPSMAKPLDANGSKNLCVPRPRTGAGR